MDIYCTYSAILMALLLFCSQLKTVYTRFPFGVRNIVNEDPEQYESDLKRDMGIMPRTHFVYINGEPEISERYSQISGEVEKAKNDEKYDSYSLRDTKPLEHHPNIKNELEELDSENSSQSNIGRIIPRAYDFKDSETDNMYYHENYDRKISTDVGNIMQGSYRATVGRELEDLSNENDDDNYENWHSENEENNYDENSENEGEFMGMRRIVHTKNRQTKTGSNEENSDENENDDVDSAVWSMPTYDENTEIEGKDNVDMNTQRTHGMNLKQYESDLNRDMGMMMSPARFGATNQEPERYSLIEGYRVNRGAMSGNTNSENDVLDMNMRRNIYTTNREPEYYNNDENYDNEDGDDVDGGTPNYDENSDDEEGTPRLEEPKMVEDTNEDYSSISGVDVGELSSPRRGNVSQIKKNYC